MQTIKVKFSLSWLIILFPTIFLIGQTSIVRDIQLIGYEKTKPYVLKREIQHPIDVPLDSSIALADKNRLENLGIFSLVDLQIFNRSENEVTIRYTVIESWRFFPMLTPLYDEKWGWSVGAMLMISNFRGRNESLTLQGQYGGQNTLEVEFTDPWITGDHVSIQINLGNDIYSHNFLPYDIRNNHFLIGFGKYLNEHIRSTIGFSVTDKLYSNESENKDYFHLVPYSKFIYDSRDLYATPSKGILSSHILLARLDTKGEENNQLVWEQSTSIFHELIDGKWNTVLGANVSSRLSQGKDLDIWYDYIGGAYSVRGWHVPNNSLFESNEQNYRFGINWITSSIELRQVVIPKFVTKLNNELGLSVAAFADVGVIDNNISELYSKSPLFGLGVGIRIPWSVINSIRLDCGWSFYNGKYIERSFHLAFGEKF